MSVLLIDLGNTRLKWQLRSAGSVLQQGVGDYDDRLTEKLPEADKVLIAAVRAHPESRRLLEQKYPEKVCWLNEPLDDDSLIRHCYSDPSRLGVDRWLAMLGARLHSSGNLLVVDAGTALTADLLTDDTRHQGGFIVPGLALSAQALFHNTERVHAYPDEKNQEGTEPGSNTLACVVQGVRRQLQSFVVSLQTDYPQYRLLVTGGDGRWLCDRLNLTYYPDLVFDGMDSLCAGSFLPW